MRKLQDGSVPCHYTLCLKGTSMEIKIFYRIGENVTELNRSMDQIGCRIWGEFYILTWQRGF